MFVYIVLRKNNFQAIELVIPNDHITIADLELESSCAVLKRIRDRRMMIKLRGGTAAFQIEVGRWQGVERKERMYKTFGYLHQ